MALKLTERKLRKELEEAERTLEFRRGRYGKVYWLEVAPVARCLCWLGDDGAAERFREAAGLVRLTGGPEPLLRLGNYLRLAGDHDGARPHLERAYVEYREEYDRTGSSDPYMLDCALLLGRDEELEVIARAEGHDYLDARLAKARRAGDSRLAAEVAEEYAENLRETRIKAGASASATSPWDFYEIALRTRAALEDGGPGPAMPRPWRWPAGPLRTHRLPHRQRKRGSRGIRLGTRSSRGSEGTSRPNSRIPTSPASTSPARIWTAPRSPAPSCAARTSPGRASSRPTWTQRTSGKPTSGARRCSRSC